MMKSLVSIKALRPQALRPSARTMIHSGLVRPHSLPTARTPLVQALRPHGAHPTLTRKLLTLTALLATATSSAASMTTAHAAPAGGGAPTEFFRKDYAPSLFAIPEIYLSFDIKSADETLVTSTSQIVPAGSAASADLVLDGEDSISLQAVKIDGAELTAGSDYEVRADGKLRIAASALPKKPFALETRVKLNPASNLALSGLYASGSNLLCTQCEAMGFRRITYHLDRPDVLTRYRVRLEADKSAYPVLLSNGNQLEAGDAGAAGSGRHFAVWEDPFLKPSYLFALVAGDLGSIHSTYTTRSGRVVSLGIFSDKGNAAKLGHAMYSIKEAMRWDEETFGLECDLDVYNIVATDDFNMGAMENKGLNSFNSAYVLADPTTATDMDYERILGVIGHEYFHK